MRTNHYFILVQWSFPNAVNSVATPLFILKEMGMPLSLLKNPSEIDHLIANLGTALITNRESFESLAKQQTGNLRIGDLPYLLDKLHNSPPVHQDIKEEELPLGEWMAICKPILP
jgi:hypothetical protein